ncbi:hypothetical protein [Pararhodobacter marinus]|uniref:hypothetical protein n=1 Tax=Pararhodobacter marinus TaxID=2184063 RepID=UPI003519AC39
MPALNAQIAIRAVPQSVWSVLDNLPPYPGWNRLASDLTRLTVGEACKVPSLTVALEREILQAAVPDRNGHRPLASSADPGLTAGRRNSGI